MLERVQLKAPCRIAGLSALLVLLGACSGAQVDSNSPAAAATNSAGTSTPEAATLKLTGSPSSSVAAGAEYSFQPTVAPVTQGVTFAIQGQPSWAEFNAATGGLTGTPTTSDEGQTSSVTITASVGGSTTSLGPFTILVTTPETTATGSATLSWSAPTSNANGSPITGLAGYHIYYGSDPSNLTKSLDVAGAATTTYVVTGLAPGTYYFAVNAYNSDGIDSVDSGMADKTI